MATKSIGNVPQSGSLTTAYARPDNTPGGYTGMSVASSQDLIGTGRPTDAAPKAHQSGIGIDQTPGEDFEYDTCALVGLLNPPINYTWQLYDFEPSGEGAEPLKSAILRDEGQPRFLEVRVSVVSSPSVGLAVAVAGNPTIYFVRPTVTEVIAVAAGVLISFQGWFATPTDTLRAQMRFLE
jgi:hypothetical protein